jgi:hypothetical protein
LLVVAPGQPGHLPHLLPAGRSQGSPGGGSHGGSHSGSHKKKVAKDEEKWVQCEGCEKWRRLPAHVDVSALPDKWYAIRGRAYDHAQI